MIGPPVLAWLLPDYSSGLAPLVWLIPGVMFLAMALPCSQYMIAVGRQRRALVAVLIATGIGALGNHIALSGGWGLQGVAAATALGYASYFALSAAMSLLIDLDTAGKIRYFVVHALAMTPVLAVVWAIEIAN